MPVTLSNKTLTRTPNGNMFSSKCLTLNKYNILSSNYFSLSKSAESSQGKAEDPDEIIIINLFV